MKYYLMGFVLVFSSLASAWAGVMPGAPSVELIPSNTVSDQPVALNAPQISEHDCCPSMSMAVQASLQIAYCPNCFDYCQCDSGDCANMGSAAVIIFHANDMTLLSHSQPIMLKAIRVNSVIQPLEYRPPKNT